MRSMRATQAAVLVSFMMVAVPVRADVVELKDGRRLEGTFKGASPAVVAIDVGGRTLVVDAQEVRAVYFGPAPAPTPSPAPPSAPPAEAPAPAGEPPRPSSQSAPSPVPQSAAVPPADTAPPFGSDAAAALNALRGLQAAVAAGVSYREYAPRVIETRATVETFLQNPASGETGLKGLMHAAMNLYALGAEAWAARLHKSGYEALATNPAADLCPALGTKMTAAREQGLLKPNRLSTGIGVAAGLPQIWACAAEKVDEAGRVMAPAAR
jgi:hypothetical protein